MDSFCSQCHNTGRANNGPIIEYCDCKYGQELKRPKYGVMYRKSDIPIELMKSTLEDFLVDKDYRKGVKLSDDKIKRKTYAKFVITKYKEGIVDVLRRKSIIIPKTLDAEDVYEGNNLFLYGGGGSGKTMLAVDILKEAIRKTESSIAAFYIMWDDLLTEFVPFDSNWRSLMYRCQRCGILCIDSLVSIDMSYDQHHVRARFNGIIKYRLLENKPTIITSNHDPIMFTKGENIFKSLINKSLWVELDKRASLT